MDGTEEKRATKLFQDSIHGSMIFDELLVKIIDTKEFQRLRNIKQLSIVYWVFPAASHNRFEHSLGVCFLAGELLKKLEVNSQDEWNEIFEEQTTGFLRSSRVKLVVQIAALLHDIGHGPFSHTWEHFVSACGETWTHEETSCRIIDLMIWKKEGNESDRELTELGEKFQETFGDVPQCVEFIKSLIKGKPSDLPEDELPHDKIAFLYQIVANKFNDIDVDKFDYFLRDAQHLNIGVPFDYRRLMNLCKIQISNNDKKTSYIAYRDVEKYSIQSIFRVRADLHVHAYQHRVAVCLEAMLIDALKAADEAGYTVGGRKLSLAHEQPLTFLKLSDSILENIQNDDDDEQYKEAKRIISRIMTRDLYKLVDVQVLKVEQSKNNKEKNQYPAGLTKDQLNKLAGSLGVNFHVKLACVNHGKYYDPLKEVKFYSKLSTITNRGFPLIKVDLPFYQIYIFDKKGDCDVKTIQKEVQSFLEDANFA